MNYLSEHWTEYVFQWVHVDIKLLLCEFLEVILLAQSLLGGLKTVITFSPNQVP